MNNVIIVSRFNLRGNSAAASRISLYSKAIALHSDSAVYYVTLSNYTNLRKDKDYNIYYGTEESGHSYINYFKELNRIIRQLKGNVTILLYPSMGCSFETLILLWSKCHGYRLICEINEVRKYASEIKSRSFMRRNLYAIQANIQEKLTKNYSGLICISKNIQQYFNSYNHNSIIVPILTESQQSISRCNYNEGICKIRFVFTGTISIEKENLIELLYGFKIFLNESHKDCELIFYGYIVFNEKKILDKLISELNLQENIIFKGRIEHSKIPEILRNADCLILSRSNNKQNYYGFSTKLSEYLTSGTVTITTNTGVIGDYLSNNKDCIMVNGYGRDGFKDAFLHFSNMTSEERYSMGQNAIKTANACFDYKQFSDQLNEFLFTK